MVRATVLFLIFAVGFGAIAPLTGGYAEASSEMPQKNRKNRKKYKKFSRQWWRAYHKRMKRQRELAASRRSLRLRQIRLANALKNSEKGTQNEVSPNEKNKIVSQTIVGAPPNGKRGKTKPGESPAGFMANGNSNFGSAVITVVSPAQGLDNYKTIGGVPTSSLRRSVIDQMIREEGWVVNDYQKEIGGKKVYFVVAYSSGVNGGATQSRLFYFMEAENRVLRIATSAPEKNLKLLEQESEKIVSSIQQKSGNVQQAELK